MSSSTSKRLKVEGGKKLKCFLAKLKIILINRFHEMGYIVSFEEKKLFFFCLWAPLSLLRRILGVKFPIKSD